MVQRSNMWYVYFRFYIDENDIIAGLNQYCKEWEPMFAIGYNYQEYKCFVDNLGGFEHWVGDMSGYISQTRESGFLDASPSDAVYDPTLLMGKARIIAPKATMLHCIEPSCNVLVRKIVGSAAADALIEIRFSTTYVLEHTLYGAYDESKLERMVYSAEIEDVSTATYSMTADLSKDKIVTPTIDSYARVLDSGNSINGFYDNYATFQEQKVTSWIIYDFGTSIHLYNITGKIYNTGSVNITWKFYGSDDKVTWTEIYSKSIPHGAITWLEDFQALDVNYRYIKIQPQGAILDDGYLYHLNFGVY